MRFVVPFSKDCPSPYHPRCVIAHDRIALEVKCIRRVLRDLKRAGWKPVVVFDGQEQINVRTESETLDAVFSVDESTVTVANGELRSWFSVVLGNRIGCIPDYGQRVASVIEAAYDTFQDWEN